VKSNPVSLDANSLVLGALGLLGALLVSAVLTGKPIPLIARDRGAFFVLLAIGVVMCALGPLRSIRPGQWARPMNVVAAVLGGLALLLGLAVLTGRRIPLIPGDRAAVIALAVLVLSKVVLAAVHHTWPDRWVR